MVTDGLTIQAGFLMWIFQPILEMLYVSDFRFNSPILVSLWALPPFS